jgi:thiol-disulfide isomerase/thioredoxin
MLDLWAPWCPPCRMIAPAIAASATRFAGRLKVVKLNVDVGPQTARNFNVQGIPIEESVELLAPVACFTHIKDERGRAPNHEFLIPGEGVFDYVRYLKAMDRAGYTGDIGVEISLMVQRRPNYDPWAAAQQTYNVVSKAFVEAGVPWEKRRR